MIVDEKQILNVVSYTNSGYWSINSSYFINKAECLRYATQNNVSFENIKYHFFDDVFSTTIKQKEPTESLEKLYTLRAKQLRDQYKYIVLAYSGGADSDNVLNSFLNNNIHIDEIVTFYPIQAIEKLKPHFNPTDNNPSNIIFEYTESALPKLLSISKTHPKIKITVLDHTNNSVNLILQNKLHLLSLGGFGASPHLAGHYMLADHLRKINESNKDAILLTGVDKPRIVFNPRSKKYSVWFDDFSGLWGNYSLEAHQGFIPKTEHFYYTVNMPHLWLKQCKVIKRTLETMFPSAEFPKNIYSLSARKNYIFNVHNMFFKKILYKDWSENIFQAKKQTSFFFPEHNNWFFKTDFVEKRAKDYHLGQLFEFISNINSQFVVYGNDGLPKRFVDCTSTIYGLD